MRFYAISGSAARRRTDCAIVGVYETGVLSAAAVQLDTALRGRLTRLVKRGDIRGKSGETLLVDAQGSTPRILLVGLGKKDALKPKAYRKAVQTAVAIVAKTGAADAVSYLSQEAVADANPYYRCRLAVEAAGNALYRIPAIRQARPPRAPALASFGIACTDRADVAATERGIEHGRALSTGMALTKNLANLPPNVCTPRYLARAARDLAKGHRRVTVQVLGEPEMRRLKMGSLLSVTAGTDEPAQLIVVRYQGGPRGEAPVALVGKGVTFDSGGISLKTPPGMDEMKFDMTGAASVLGAIEAAAAAGLALNIVGVIPAVENMPGGSATKPGDVVRSLSGQTIEILNTDAEGRLILCDAITYARRFKPSVVVDVATLTGACVVALGAHLAAVMSNDDALAAELVAAGRRAEDRLWHMPIAEEYEEQLRSNFADMANAAGREGGAITAACFLSKFAHGLRWAHLDIAGVAWTGGAQKGSTGRPVSMLVDFLLQRAAR